ncbi:MAG: hypothetical protein ACOC0Z_07205 [Halohasta sp.]
MGVPRATDPPGDAEASSADEEAAEDVDLMELSLKERIALATVQQPTIGLGLVLLSLFAFTFFIALALAYPSVAGLFVAAVVVLGLVAAGVLWLLRRTDAS